MLEQYVNAVGGRLELKVVKGDKTIASTGVTPPPKQRGKARAAKRVTKSA